MNSEKTYGTGIFRAKLKTKQPVDSWRYAVLLEKKLKCHGDRRKQPISAFINSLPSLEKSQHRTVLIISYTERTFFL